jgi:hypothetical protein
MNVVGRNDLRYLGDQLVDAGEADPLDAPLPDGTEQALILFKPGSICGRVLVIAAGCCASHVLPLTL